MSDSLKKVSDLLIFGEQPEQFTHGHLFPLSDLSKSLTVAHFWWATWAICSHCWERIFCFFKKLFKKMISFEFFLSKSLVFLWVKEKKERFAQKTSDLLILFFVLSNLSKSLTLAHLSWATRAIRSHSLICPERFERLSDEQMSEFPTLLVKSHCILASNIPRCSTFF